MAVLLSGSTIVLQAQTPAGMRMSGINKRQVLEEHSLVSQVPFRNIGPSIMSGRVTDLAVNPDKPEEFYVAYASGGLWYTNNNGQSFQPLFQQEDVMTIGAIAVNWETGVIWVGTGEVNSSRSSYAGIGMYKSADRGQSWQYAGLPESHHIGSVVMHPDDPNTVWVAVLGHLFTTNPERGVYKTTDGGEHWKKVLFVDDKTGAVEVTIDPVHPERLYACMWQRDRKAWNFTEAGSGSGIWGSEDGGDNWKLLTGSNSGFPSGEGMGRSGLAIFPGNTNVLYAVVDNQSADPSKATEQDTSVMTMNDLKDITKEKFLALDDDKLNAFLQQQGVDEKFTAAYLKDQVQSGAFRPTVLNEYLNLGAYVFNLPIHGCEVYKSTDRGEHWVRVNETDLGSMYYTYGYYFGKIYVSELNSDLVYILGVPVAMSTDGGKHFTEIGKGNVHADHHVLWVDPADDGHLILGNDGGVNITYDHGQKWFKANDPPVGQFYSVTVDDAKPYHVYGGLQDNGVWSGPSDYQADDSWLQDGRYPFRFLYGGDGMQVQVDTRDNKTFYTGYQFGFYARMNLDDDNDYMEIRPRHEMGEYPLRFNWQTPILLSRHNQDVFYYGSNRFHRSLNKGEMLETLSDDLSGGGKDGDVPYGTITAISESPLRFGLLYAGTDDGHVHLSVDGGYTWNEISAGLPPGLWVSRVVASAHELNRVYLTMNGYRNDDFRSLVFVSNDRGKSWKPLATDLPAEPVNVIREDAVNPSLLYIGTDNGLYISLNGGVSCMAFMGTGEQRLPRVAVHDLAIQEREQELVVATHGRSLFVADISHVRALNDSLLNVPLHLFPHDKMPWRSGQGNGSSWNTLAEPYVQTTELVACSKTATSATLQVMLDTIVLYTRQVVLMPGLNYLEYDLSAATPPDNWKAADNGVWYLQPGVYSVHLSTDGMAAQPIELELVEKR